MRLRLLLARPSLRSIDRTDIVVVIALRHRTTRIMAQKNTATHEDVSATEGRVIFSEMSERKSDHFGIVFNGREGPPLLGLGR